MAMNILEQYKEAIKKQQAQLEKIAKIDSRFEKLESNSEKLEPQGELVPRPNDWRRRPTRAQYATRRDVEELLDDVDDYFEAVDDAGQRPTFSDLAGRAGFDSVSQLVNHARRTGGLAMRGLSRAILAVQSHYEELAAQGNKNAMQLLALLPSFDSSEPANQKPQLPFASVNQFALDIAGLESPETEGRHLTPHEAYNRIMQFRTYEEIMRNSVVEKDITPAEYKVVDIPNKKSLF